MECQICLEVFVTDISPVSCGSQKHWLCYGCEGTWRGKMPLQNGIRVMKCPTCRQPEQSRTIESLQREATRVESTVSRGESTVSRARSVRVSSEGQDRPRGRCASGRNCRSTSQTGRSMTYLKCIACSVVFCCRTCTVCVGCRPFPSYMLPYVERLRL
jgi:hypothetical protein